MGRKAKLVIDGKKLCFKCGRVLPVGDSEAVLTRMVEYL
ncbi:hypothetical protein LCGC14_3107930, partial [marine sediment metagenome]